MELMEYRDYYINEIKAAALNSNVHPIVAFNEDIIDMMINDYGVVSELHDCYFQWLNGNKAFKSMKTLNKPFQSYYNHIPFTIL